MTATHFGLFPPQADHDDLVATPAWLSGAASQSWHFEAADGFEDFATTETEAQQFLGLYLTAGTAFTVNIELA